MKNQLFLPLFFLYYLYSILYTKPYNGDALLFILVLILSGICHMQKKLNSFNPNIKSGIKCTTPAIERNGGLAIGQLE